MTLRCAFGIGAAVLLAAPALAQIHQGDIALTLTDNTIRVGDFDGPEFVDVCVYGIDLINGAANDPGFDSNNNVFPTNLDLGLTIVTPLYEWDGTGFGQIAAEPLSVTWGPFTPALSPAQEGLSSDAIALGVSGSGEFHYHYTFRIPASLSGGVYTAGLVVRNEQGSLLPSETFFLVFDHDASEGELDLALAFVEGSTDFCSTVPDCAGDINTTGTTNGLPDGQTNLSDLQYFLTLWQLEEAAADVNTTGTTNGLPDEEVNLSDLQFYLTLWQQGTGVCP